jgi:hypothetical protein
VDDLSQKSKPIIQKTAFGAFLKNSPKYYISSFYQETKRPFVTKIGTNSSGRIVQYAYSPTAIVHGRQTSMHRFSATPNSQLQKMTEIFSAMIKL